MDCRGKLPDEGDEAAAGQGNPQPSLVGQWWVPPGFIAGSGLKRLKRLKQWWPGRFRD